MVLCGLKATVMQEERKTERERERKREASSDRDTAVPGGTLEPCVDLPLKVSIRQVGHCLTGMVYLYSGKLFI
jgi:hypothetical protein